NQSNDISDVDDSEDISSDNLTENSSHNDQNNASEFNYQEIDLDNVSSVHNIDNNQVYESLDETANPTVNLSDEPEITAMDVSQDEAGSSDKLTVGLAVSSKDSYTWLLSILCTELTL